jgi:hypothetical protein
MGLEGVVPGISIVTALDGRHKPQTIPEVARATLEKILTKLCVFSLFLVSVLTLAKMLPEQEEKFPILP